MNDIYMRIENLCRNREVDITTMCKEAGVSRAIMSEFKMGRTKKLSTDTLEKLSNYFSVPIDYLLTGEEMEQKNKPSAQGEELTNDEIEVMKLFGVLPKEKRDMAIRHIQFLLHEDQKDHEEK